MSKHCPWPPLSLLNEGSLWILELLFSILFFSQGPRGHKWKWKISLNMEIMRGQICSGQVKRKSISLDLDILNPDEKKRKLSMDLKDKWCFLGRRVGAQVGPIETTGAFNKVAPLLLRRLPLQRLKAQKVTSEACSDEILSEETKIS